MIDLLIIAVVITNLLMLSSTRLRSIVWLVAFQGMALGVFALVARWNHLAVDIVVIGLVAFLFKGVIFPLLLRRLINSIHLEQEDGPFVSYILSVIIGILLLMISLWLGERLPIPGNDISILVMPATFFSIFCGLFIIVSRKNAISQVAGFLVMENGAFMIGVGTLYYAPFLVEIGTLLDMLVAVMIWVVLIKYIHRAFHHIDTSKLERLKG